MNKPRFMVTPDAQRHLLVLLACAGVGAVLAGLLWPLDTEALAALRQEVEQLQAQAQVAQRKAHASAPMDSAARQALPMPDEPDLAEGVMVWPWLQQRLRAHGLQVQALRPHAVTRLGQLPQQSVAVRLQGRWRDWLAFEEAWNWHAPWWVIDHWQVVPAGAPSDEVRIELQVRLAFRPPGLPANAATRVWPEWPVPEDGRSMPSANLFAQDATPVATALAAALAGDAAPQRPEDPRRGSVHALRLLGVWQQAGTAHAVLGDGLNPIVVRQGQRIGREAYRVRRIGDDQVELGASGARAEVLRLKLAGDKP